MSFLLFGIQVAGSQIARCADHDGKQKMVESWVNDLFSRPGAHEETYIGSCRSLDFNT